MNGSKEISTINANPVCRKRQYAQTVIENLPCLEMVDNCAPRELSTLLAMLRSSSGTPAIDRVLSRSRQRAGRDNNRRAGDGHESNKQQKQRDERLHLEETFTRRVKLDQKGKEKENAYEEVLELKDGKKKKKKKKPAPLRKRVARVSEGRIRGQSWHRNAEQYENPWEDEAADEEDKETEAHEKRAKSKDQAEEEGEDGNQEKAEKNNHKGNKRNQKKVQSGPAKALLRLRERAREKEQQQQREAVGIDGDKLAITSSPWHTYKRPCFALHVTRPLWHSNPLRKRYAVFGQNLLNSSLQARQRTHASKKRRKPGAWVLKKPCRRRESVEPRLKRRTRTWQWLSNQQRLNLPRR